MGTAITLPSQPEKHSRRNQADVHITNMKLFILLIFIYTGNCRKVDVDYDVFGSPTDDCDDTDEDSPCYIPSPEQERCGLERDIRRRRGTLERSRRAVGGEDSRLGEFPFLALLGKSSKKSPGSISWYCGGSLINKWYVLTGAQCGSEVEYVRLGEWKVVDPDSYTPTTDHWDIFEGAGLCYFYNDVSKIKCLENRLEYDNLHCNNCEKLDSSIDCVKDRRYDLCSEGVQDIDVAEVKIHPGYEVTDIGSPINDIMLLKLSRPAEFNQFVKPVCLPSSDLNRYGEPYSAIFGNNRATHVGWGKTYTEKDEDIKIVSTAIQQKLEMPAVGYADCLAKWKSFGIDVSKYFMPDQHFCAGGEEGKDSCNGDGGGPLMAREDDVSPWQLVGFSSFGTRRCGAGAPHVFTRVTHFNQWIRNNMV